MQGSAPSLSDTLDFPLPVQLAASVQTPVQPRFHASVSARSGVVAMGGKQTTFTFNLVIPSFSQYS